MPSFRDRERDEAEAQAKKTAAQREELKKRAAKRAKERAKAGLGATTSATGNTMGAATRGGPGNANAAAIVKPTAGVVGRPPKPARVGAPPGPRETRWGLAPSEWTGDVGAELVTLQAQNLALRREREKWEAERKRLEDAARAAGAPQYGRQAAPSPPPPSIPSSDDEDEETKAQSPKSPKPRGSNRAPPKATPRDAGGTRNVQTEIQPSRPSSSRGAFEATPSGRTSRGSSRGSGRHRPRAATIDDVFSGD